MKRPRARQKGRKSDQEDKKNKDVAMTFKDGYSMILEWRVR